MFLFLTCIYRWGSMFTVKINEIKSFVRADANDVRNVEKCGIESSFIYQEWYAPLNRSVHFVLYNPSKSGAYDRVPSNIPFFLSEKSGWYTYLDIFSQVGLKSGVWKVASFLSSCIPGLIYSPQSYMINILLSSMIQTRVIKPQSVLQRAVRPE